MTSLTSVFDENTQSLLGDLYKIEQQQQQQDDDIQPQNEEHKFNGKSIDISPVPVIKTSPMVVDDLQMVNNALTSLGYETLPSLFFENNNNTSSTSPSSEQNSHQYNNNNASLKILKTIQKLTSQRRRDIALIESTSNRLKACEADRKRLSSDKKQLKLQVKGLEKDVKTALFQIDEQTKKFKKEKKILEDVKIQLEKRCVRLQTRDTSYQAKIRKKEVEYEKLKERLQNKQYNNNDSTMKQRRNGSNASSSGMTMKRRTSNSTINKSKQQTIRRRNNSKTQIMSYGSIVLSENIEPSTFNTYNNNAMLNETEYEKSKANNLTSIVNDMYIEKQKEILSENGRYKLQINNMEAQLKELQRIVNEQEDMLLRTQGGNNMRSSSNGKNTTTTSSRHHMMDNISPVAIATSTNHDDDGALSTSNIDWDKVPLQVDLNGIENL